MAPGRVTKAFWTYRGGLIERANDEAGTYTQEWWSLKFGSSKLSHRLAASSGSLLSI